MKKKKANFKKNGQKDAAAFMKNKPVRKIMEYYYFPSGADTAREIINNVGDKYKDAADIWPELNLVEVVLNTDSLIFQDAGQCFVDPLDLQWFDEHGISVKFQISFDINDAADVREIMKNIMSVRGGMICSDTDNFQPSYTLENIGTFPGENGGSGA